MKKYCLDMTLRSKEVLGDRHVLLRLTQDSPLPKMFPGQFVEIRVDHSPSTMLRRPISINYVDVERNELWLLVAAIGDGTREIAARQPGDIINLIYPLGNAFSSLNDVSRQLHATTRQHTTPNPLQPHKLRVLLIGGGVGVAPLLFQGRQIVEAGGEPHFLLGARSSKDLLELDYFRKLGPLHITTEDASAGEKGFVTNHSVLRNMQFDFIQTCGPKPMMMAVARYAREVGIPCEASLENLMACGLGACLCCVEKTTEGNLCVCKEGPVFNIKKLLW